MPGGVRGLKNRANALLCSVLVLTECACTALICTVKCKNMFSVLVFWRASGVPGVSPVPCPGPTGEEHAGDLLRWKGQCWNPQAYTRCTVALPHEQAKGTRASAPFTSAVAAVIDIVVTVVV